VRFWDSSSLLALVIEEKRSQACRRLTRFDPEIAVWALTRTEIVSAIRRRERAGNLTRAEAGSGLRRLERMAEHWLEVDALALVRSRAERLLATHPLKAANAIQLGAALVLSKENPRGKPLVTSDQHLSEAADAEGFDVLVPQP